MTFFSWILFYFFCFVSVLLSLNWEEIVRFSHFGFPVLGRVRSRDLFSIFGIVHEVSASELAIKRVLTAILIWVTVFPALYSEYTTVLVYFDVFEV